MEWFPWAAPVVCQLLWITGVLGQVRTATPSVYQSVERDYVVTFPPGWRQITKAEFDAQVMLFKQQTGSAAPTYPLRLPPAQYPPTDLV